MSGRRIQTWIFCLRSLGKEYGWGFMGKVVLPHPVLTLRGLKNYIRGTFGAELGPYPVLGLGFCLKPLDPACISGRFNHDCYYFENNLTRQVVEPPSCCRDCVIRSLGETALKCGFGVYIMTSAHDILNDLLLPALRDKRFSFALLGLCAYSMEPFKMALSIVGLESRIFPFKSGDCRDFHSWLQADTGIKEERTEFEDWDIKQIQDILTEKIIPVETPLSISKTAQVFSPSLKVPPEKKKNPEL